jgi:hypothetical protein
MSEMPGFKKSSFSVEVDKCVEVALLPGGGALVRDSKDQAGPVLSFDAAEWSAFRSGVKGGEFDLT